MHGRCAPFQYRRTVAAADVVGNLSGIAFVVHQKEIELPHVADQEFLQTVREEMSRLLVATVTNLSDRKKIVNLGEQELQNIYYAPSAWVSDP